MPEPDANRLRVYRIRAGLTQDEVAEQLRELAWTHRRVRSGTNSDMISKYERGQRRPNKLNRDLLCLLYGATPAQLGLLRSAATVEPATEPPQPAAARHESPLTLDDVERRRFLQAAAAAGALGALPRAPGPITGLEVDVATLRGVLISYTAIPVTADDAPVHPPQRAAGLQTGARRVWQAFQESRYSWLSEQLPRLLISGRAASDVLDGDDARRASAALSHAYQVTAIMLLKLGESQLALVAADRAVHSAESSQDRRTVASAARILAYALMAGGHFHQAKQLTIDAANTLEAGLSPARPGQVSLYGALLLKGAMAAAFDSDRTTSRALLAEADQVGRLLGGDANHWWTAFGPTNVDVHRVSAAIELGDGPLALAAARRVHPGQLPVIERRASHLVDVARAFHLTGRNRSALDSLLAAERLAPEEVRCQPAARSLVTDLINSRSDRSPTQLRALALRTGVTT